MASTNTELLEAILNDLNIIIESSKKRGPENLKFSGLNINAGPITAVASALGTFLYSITQFSTVKNETVKKACDAMETVYATLSKIEINKEQKESITASASILQNLVQTLNSL